jgi:hypothetical protein
MSAAANGKARSARRRAIDLAGTFPAGVTSNLQGGQS